VVGAVSSHGPTGNNSAEGNGLVCQTGRPQVWLLSGVQGTPTYFTSLIFIWQILLSVESNLPAERRLEEVGSIKGMAPFRFQRVKYLNDQYLFWKLRRHHCHILSPLFWELGRIDFLQLVVLFLSFLFFFLFISLFYFLVQEYTYHNSDVMPFYL
jgi:hypothetical protein